MSTVSHKFEIKVYTIHRLRVNYLSLVAESRIIRKEVKRAGAIYRDAMHRHRVDNVRNELRITGLALAFVRGRAYRKVEVKGSKKVDVNEIYLKLKRLLFPTTLKELQDWISKD